MTRSLRKRTLDGQFSVGPTRREFLEQAGGGFAGLALTHLLVSEDAAAAGSLPQPHFSAKAKHCVFLFMNGGPSQVDTFDPKPALARLHGKSYTGDTSVGSNGRPIGNLMKSPFECRPRQSEWLTLKRKTPRRLRCTGSTIR